MTPSSIVISERPIAAPSVTAKATRPRPFFWSVRRELWENRSILLGPLGVASFLVSIYLLSILANPSRLGVLLASDAASRHDAIANPYVVAIVAVALVAFVAGVFYSLNALRGERRDRSLLFWKSLPVSDATTVLSKAAIVLVVIPLVVFAVTMVVHASMLVIGSAALLATRGNPVTLWRELPLFDRPLVLLYAVGSLALQQAPLYAWLLMVSAWARRWAILWALLPPYGIVAAEQMLYGHSRFRELIRDLVVGSFARSFGFDANGTAVPVVDRLILLEPAAVFGRPAFWVGLALAAGFLVVAIRIRRDREPL